MTATALAPSSVTSQLAYLSGFGNEFATEAMPGALAGRPQLAAARRVRPVRRAAVGHRLHGAAQPQPALVAVPRAARGGPSPVPRDRHGPLAQPLRRGRDAAEPAALGPDADADRADRLHRRPDDDRRQRRLRHPPLRVQPLDGGPLLLRRRRRAADRAAGRRAADRDRARHARRGAAGDRRRAARRALSRRTARGRGGRARLHLRELSARCCGCRTSA